MGAWLPVLLSVRILNDFPKPGVLADPAKESSRRVFHLRG